MKKNKSIGILFGTFDILHKGHLNLFKQARQKSDYLIAVIARDKTVKMVKNKYPLNSETNRKKNVVDSKLANKTILGNLHNKLAVIKKYQPDIIFLGYDQKAFTENLQSELNKLKVKAKIIKLKPFKPNIYKTSKILNKNNS